MRLLLVAGLAGAVQVALAQDAPPAEKTGWKDEGELGIVATSGNSESETLGLKNRLWREWERSSIEIKAGAVRVETTTRDSFVTEVSPGVTVRSETTEVTAENYFLNGRYQRKISERLFWFAGAGWDRNEPAGIENRYLAEAGAGHTWYARDDLKFSSFYGVTFTDQEDVVPDPNLEDSFLGARAGWDYWNALTATTQYTNTLVLDYNLDESDDWRGDMLNAITVTMSRRLALKAGYRMLYDNLPAMEALTVLDTAGVPTGATELRELDELDTIFTASLVVTFR